MATRLDICEIQLERSLFKVILFEQTLHMTAKNVKETRKQMQQTNITYKYNKQTLHMNEKKCNRSKQTNLANKHYIRTQQTNITYNCKKCK